MVVGVHKEAFHHLSLLREPRRRRQLRRQRQQQQLYQQQLALGDWKTSSRQVLQTPALLLLTRGHEGHCPEPVHQPASDLSPALRPLSLLPPGSLPQQPLAGLLSGPLCAFSAGQIICELGAASFKGAARPLDISRTCLSFHCVAVDSRATEQTFWCSWLWSRVTWRTLVAVDPGVTERTSVAVDSGATERTSCCSWLWTDWEKSCCSWLWSDLASSCCSWLWSDWANSCCSWLWSDWANSCCCSWLWGVT